MLRQSNDINASSFICEMVIHRLPFATTGDSCKQTDMILQKNVKFPIIQLLLAFDEVYNSATEAEQKEFMKAFIERIDLFPEKQKDGNWIKNIVFNFPVPMDGGEVKELPLEYETTVETSVCCLKKICCHK